MFLVLFVCMLMEAVITERGSTMKQMGHLVHLSNRALSSSLQGVQMHSLVR